VFFTLNGGSRYGNRLYLLMGSMSGMSKPWRLGAVSIPLSFDFYTLYTILYPNSPVLSNSLGRLSPGGSATARLTIYPNLFSSSLVGHHIYHACIVFGPLGLQVTAASNPVRLLLGP